MKTLMPVILLGVCALAAGLPWTPDLRRRMVAALSLAAAAALLLDAHGALTIVALATVLVGTCVVMFAIRQFEDDQRSRTIAWRSAAVVAAAVATTQASTVSGLVGWWVATSVMTLTVLAAGTGSWRHSVVRRAALSLLASDALLVVVAGVAIASAHGTSLAALASTSQVARNALWAAAAVAAVARAGLTWRRSWVTDTVATPTAVSALLHAGVVNGGAILLFILTPPCRPARALDLALAVVCTATMAALAPRIHDRVDLKGQLAVSTVSQMAFMLLIFSLGFPLLALAHVVGHAAYKAHRFITAANAIETRSARRQLAASGSTRSLVERVGGLAIIGAVVAAGIAVANIETRVALVIFGLGAGALWWTRTTSPGAGVALLAGCTVVAVTYPFALGLLGTHLANSTSAITFPWWVPAIALGVAFATSRRRHAARHGHAPKVASMSRQVLAGVGA